MSDTTTPFNPNALPYAFDTTRYSHPPVPELHTFMCDLHMKVPNVKFAADGRTYTRSEGNSECHVDEVNVFNGLEKVGRIWITRAYDKNESKTVSIYNISSPRINNARGSRNRKYSKHYGTVLKAACQVFSAVPPKQVVAKIMEDAEYRLRSMDSHAYSQVAYAVRGNETAVLDYLKDVEDNGPTPVPQSLNSKLGNWRDKMNNARIASTVWTAWCKKEGLVVKMLPTGEMIVVDLTITDEFKTATSSYDLPDEYQTKLTMLKLMEVNQPIEGVGAKVEYDSATYFYMPSGEIPTSC